MSDVTTSIHNAARTLWLDRGFNQVSIAEICEAANVSNSTFFYHYKSVTELGLAVFGEIVPVTDLITVLVTTHGDSASVIDRMLDLTVERMHGHDQLVTALMKEQLGSPVMWNDPVGLMYVFNFLVQRGQVRGEIRADLDPVSAADSIAAAFAGLCARAAAEACPTSELAERMRRVAHLLLRRFSVPELASP